MAEDSGALLREWQIIGDPKRGIAPLVPVGKTKFYEMVRKGSFPAPVKLPGGRANAWRSVDVHAWIESTAGGSAVPATLSDAEARVIAALIRGPLLAHQLAELAAPADVRKLVARLRRIGFELPTSMVRAEVAPEDDATIAHFEACTALSAGDRAHAARLGVTP